MPHVSSADEVYLLGLMFLALPIFEHSELDLCFKFKIWLLSKKSYGNDTEGKNKNYSFQLKSSLLYKAEIFYWSSAIAFFLSAISLLIIYSVGSFLFFFSYYGLFLMPSSLISSLRLEISLMRSTFSFMIRIFSCLWISESFCKFFLSMLILFSRYFFWFLYYCSISESIFTWVMLWLQNLFFRSVACSTNSY